MLKFCEKTNNNSDVGMNYNFHIFFISYKSYLWLGFGLPFFLMLFSVVALKCSLGIVLVRLPLWNSTLGMMIVRPLNNNS